MAEESEGSSGALLVSLKSRDCRQRSFEMLGSRLSSTVTVSTSREAKHALYGRVTDTCIHVEQRVL